MSRRHLVIFARAPRLGTVKRRLARVVGAVEATRFYRHLLARQLRLLARDRRWTVWLFVTPDTSRTDTVWRPVPKARVRGQGQGDLGRRMRRPFAILPPGPVVLVGSDIPALRPDHVERAFRRLGACDLVFGPATDGGFWLVGARRLRPLPAGLFAAVRWSTAQALADSLAGLPSSQRVGLVDTLADVDEADDYRRYRATASLRAASSAGRRANSESQSPGRV